MALCVYKMLDRRLEKTKLNAYMVYIRYDGSNYVCFDELKDQKTVKGYFKDLLKKENIDVYKGIQQAVKDSFEYIKKGVRHRVKSTSEDCIWLCVFIKC